MAETHVRMGDLLVRAGLVSEKQLGDALASQRTSGRRLGEELVHLGILTEVQMTQVLSNQLAIPWVSLYHVEWSRELLRLVPAELAEKYRIVPVYVRQVRRAGDTLFVAMDDPTNVAALQAVAEASGLPVKPLIAPPTDIQNAIRVYYFGERPAAPAPAAAKPTPSERPRAPAAKAAPEPKAQSTAEPAKPSSEPPGEDRQSAPPVQPSTKPKAAEAPGPRFVTLTLLDGTTVKLPAPTRGASAEVRPDESLTARDIVNALHARAQGKDVSDVLPDARWEPLLATLLEVLLRKGLVADWEFVAELEKHKK